MTVDKRNELWRGRFLAIGEVDGWEYCTRTTAGAVVTVVAVTPAETVLLTEQYRPPLGARVIELPAGLAGDDPDRPDETLAEAAERELIEETGYRAERLRPLISGPTSAGLTDEFIHFFVAEGLRRDGPGGGVDGERIEVHEVAVDGIVAWLKARQDAGVLVDFKVYAGLFLLGYRRD